MRVGNVLPWIAVGLAMAALIRRRRARLPTTPEHVTETLEAFQRAGTRVVILGAGFGGLGAALALDHLIGDRPDVSVLVIDRNNRSLFTPLLWTVAGGQADAVDTVVPIRDFQRGRRFHVLQAEVTGIDLRNREVLTDVGPRQYDYLVIALGSVTAIPPLPGLAERARTFRTPADAMSLRDRLIDAVEAAHRATDEAERRAWLTFVVAGGGDTGAELAAMIHSYLAEGLLREYPWLARAPAGPSFHVILVGRAPRLLPMVGWRESDAVRRTLERIGIEVQTGTAVEAVRPDAVVTSSGVIPTHTTFWAAGISAPPVLRSLLTPHAKGGVLIVDERLRLPDYPNVFVVGDSAWAFDATGRPVPPTAQAAQLSGDYVARAIAAQIQHRADVGAFRYSPRGHLSLLGTGQAVARVGPLLLTGVPAWLGWHAYYLYRIPSWKRRIALVVSWLLAASFGRETAQIRLKQTGPVAAAPAVRRVA